MQTILFVDDDPLVLQALSRGIRTTRGRYRVLTAQSGSAALDLLDTHACDAIVSDVRMPGVDGHMLLAHVARSWPAVFRLVLSGDAAPDDLVNLSRRAHRFLRKPCPTGVILGVLGEALQNPLFHGNPTIRAFVGSTASLPTPAATVRRLHRALERHDKEDVLHTIATDIALSFFILRVANWHALGDRPIQTVRAAVEHVGLNFLDDARHGGLLTSPSGEDLDALASLINRQAVADASRQHPHAALADSGPALKILLAWLPNLLRLAWFTHDDSVLSASDSVLAANFMRVMWGAGHDPAHTSAFAVG